MKKFIKNVLRPRTSFNGFVLSDDLEREIIAARHYMR